MSFDPPRPVAPPPTPLTEVTLAHLAVPDPTDPGHHHPVVVAHREYRRSDLQLRLADTITRFAGSMWFVYVHAIGFAVWMMLAEASPWPTLTLVVSLEAIFLSTFVMIGQNRQATFQQMKADHDFLEQELELKTNTELTRAIHTMLSELQRRLDDTAPQVGSGPAALGGMGEPGPFPIPADAATATDRPLRQ
ncbi:DUF1003 domain-containing protein [Nocardia thailandica]